MLALGGGLKPGLLRPLSHWIREGVAGTLPCPWPLSTCGSRVQNQARVAMPPVENPLRGLGASSQSRPQSWLFSNLASP